MDPISNTKKVHKERPTFVRVYYSVFIEFFTDIGKSVLGFFIRYFRLIWDCLKFVWRPDAEYHEKIKDKTLKNAKYTFQLILILTSIIIFLIKRGVVQSGGNLKEVYGDDIQQYTIEGFFFLAYAASFFFVMTLLILIGRLLRVIFKPIEDRDVTDRVFIHLNNIFFLFSVIFSFINKFNSSYGQLFSNDFFEWLAKFGLFFWVSLFILIFTFFIRLVIINHAKGGKALVYGLIVPLIICIFLGICGLVVAFLFLLL